MDSLLIGLLLPVGDALGLPAPVSPPPTADVVVGVVVLIAGGLVLEVLKGEPTRCGINGRDLSFPLPVPLLERYPLLQSDRCVFPSTPGASDSSSPSISSPSSAPSTLFTSVLFVLSNDKKEFRACAMKRSFSSILVTDEMSERSVRAVFILDPLEGKSEVEGVGGKI